INNRESCGPIGRSGGMAGRIGSIQAAQDRQNPWVLSCASVAIANPKLMAKAADTLFHQELLLAHGYRLPECIKSSPVLLSSHSWHLLFWGRELLIRRLLG